ncbi:MAG: glycosyltransferase [Thermodesulforhabdaceae bacterium]
MGDKKLSLCMIVKNEAHQLGELLNQVKDAVDEIIIVDTGSEDNTVEIANRYTPFVFSFPWKDDFALARNFALEHAHGDYFLWLDADDRLPEDSVKKLSLLKKYFDRKTFFLFILEDIKNQKVNSCFYQIRCAPLRKDIRFRHRVHEELLSSLTEAGCKGATTDIVIRHYGYTDPVILKRKMKRNLELLLKDFDFRRHSADYILLLAISYLYFERHDEALSVLKDYIEQHSFNTVNRVALGEIYQMLGHIESLRNNKAEALRWFVRAEAIGELGKAELYRLGCFYETLGEFKRALRSFQLSLDAPYSIRPVPTIPDPPKWEVNLRITGILLGLGKYEEAKNFFKEATNDLSKDRAFDWLMWHLIALEQYSTSEKVIGELGHDRKIPEDKHQFYKGITSLFSGNIEEAMKNLHASLRKDRENKHCKRGLALGYLLNGSYHRALGLYKELVLSGVLEYDVIIGGLFCSIMKNGQNIEIFEKTFRRFEQPEETNFQDYQIKMSWEKTRLLNNLIVALEQAKKEGRPETLPFIRLILKIIKKAF